MFKAISHSAESERRPAGALLASAFVLGCLALGTSVQAVADMVEKRQLTVEQNAIYDLHAPAPAVVVPEPLSVVAWVDHPDNTYAVGETVRLYVQANKDAQVTVMNVGPTGNTTLLFPNALQPDGRVAANQVVEIPPAGSGASIKVGGPVGRELIKVIASTSSEPVVPALNVSGSGPFAPLESGRSLAKQLQVTMNAQPEAEWDDYNKVITTIAARPTAVVPLAAAPMGTAWPAQPFGLRIAAGKPVYRMGEPVLLYASTTAPCYLTLVNIGSSGQSRVLLPNAAQPQNLIPAGQTVVFPVTGSNLQLTPMGPPGVETVVATCSADNQPVFPAGLSYGQSGFAAMGLPGAASRDLGVVMAGPAPNRQVGQATVGFVVTQ
jgi:hypothetical protein